MLDFFSTKIAYADAVDNFIHKVDAYIINPLILLLFGLAILFFLYGVVEFLINQANEEKKTAGKSHMIWGIVGITIMLGVWTIMNFILSTLGIGYIKPQSGKVDTLPEIDLPSNLR